MWSMRRTCFFFAALALACNTSKPTSHRNDDSVKSDPWFHFPPMEFIRAKDCLIIPENHFRPVIHRESEALERLVSAPSIKLTPQEASELTGRSFDKAPGELFLLRALTMNEGTGKFTVSWRDDRFALATAASVTTRYRKKDAQLWRGFLRHRPRSMWIALWPSDRYAAAPLVPPGADAGSVSASAICDKSTIVNRSSVSG